LLQRLLPCALPLLLWGSEERERGTDGGERKTGEDERMGILLFSPLDFGLWTGRNEISSFDFDYF
jgi:hypothetical protein